MKMPLKAAGLVLLAVACSRATMPARYGAAAPLDSPEKTFELGVARADITPPPGVATFGHGPDARVTHGLWTRLYCRVFLLVSDGQPLALVPCDLPAVGTLLQRRVVEEANRLHVPLPASRLMLSATHTHAGPGHYLDGKAYTGLGSSEVPGFDPHMLEFLARRIGRAIASAYDERTQGSVRWLRGEVFGLTRNRDLAAFYLNANAPFAEHCPAGTLVESCAIDPELHVLELRRHDDCALGALAFFAMHPTVLPNTNRLLGADAFGVASRDVEAFYRRRPGSECYSDPLVGIVNANEGDASPTWTTGSVTEASSIGTRLGQEIAALLSSPEDFDAKPEIHARYVEIDMRSNDFGIHEPVKPGRGDVPTCHEAELGELASLGANDHPTFLYGVNGAGPQPDPDRRDCQAPKRGFCPLFHPLASGNAAFTSIVPVSLVQVGDEAITFVPAELTTAAGLELKNSVKQAFAESGHKVYTAVGGLTNGYILYVTTPEEYRLQGYEGASNLFGPGSGPLLARTARALARSVHNPGTPLPAKLDRAGPIRYSLGPERDRLPRGQGEASLEDVSGARRPLQLCAVRDARPPAVCFIWRDAAPGVAPITHPRWVGLQAASRAVLLDDRSAAFRTQVHGRQGDLWLWSTLMQPTDEEWTSFAGKGLLRIVANVDLPYAVSSQQFSRESLPAPCSAEQQMFCGL
jgi:neutral ceramidase